MYWQPALPDSSATHSLGGCSHILPLMSMIMKHKLKKKNAAKIRSTLTDARIKKIDLQ